ncbi:MAG: DUF2188 domain-containing protein [Chloroflexota bacterium]|nr:DUF2188 domain-containing protein [Chloroflexota bacterium]
MSWTYTEYPPSMKNLDAHVREKAIDIANALIDEGYVVGSAIPIGIAQAKKWAEGDDDKDRSRNFHVVPHPHGWAIRRANAERSSVVVDTKEDARNQAIALATADSVDVIIHGENGEFEDYISLLSDSQPAVSRVTNEDATDPAI